MNAGIKATIGGYMYVDRIHEDRNLFAPNDRLASAYAAGTATRTVTRVEPKVARAESACGLFRRLWRGVGGPYSPAVHLADEASTENPRAHLTGCQIARVECRPCGRRGHAGELMPCTGIRQPLADTCTLNFGLNDDCEGIMTAPTAEYLDSMVKVPDFTRSGRAKTRPELVRSVGWAATWWRRVSSS